MKGRREREIKRALGDFHGSPPRSRERMRLKGKLFVSSLASQNVYLVKSIRSRSNDYLLEIPRD